MRIGIFGGSFNPPHKGHVLAAENAVKFLSLDQLLVMPAREPPHKRLSPDSPQPAERAELCKIAFADVPSVQISETELCREGPSYTADTIMELRQQYPDAEFYLLMGTDMFCCFTSWYEFAVILRECTLAVFCREDDMFCCFTSWYEFAVILRECTLAVFCREDGENEKLETALHSLQAAHSARIVRIPFEPLAVSSTEIRNALSARIKPDSLPESVYSEIIRTRCYGARPEFEWLRTQSYACLKPKRIPHVQGTEEEAVRLAKKWGADTEDAAEAAILHDITKKLELNEQLILCEKYGIVNDTSETENAKLLHAKTGAAYAREHFGVSDAVYDAIRWHTTGRAGMTLLEKVIYMADYIEPNRDFPDVDKLRELAYKNLDEAMILGLEMSLLDLQSYGIVPHVRSREALEELKEKISR